MSSNKEVIGGANEMSSMSREEPLKAIVDNAHGEMRSWLSFRNSRSILTLTACAALIPVALAQTPIALDVDASAIASQTLSAHEVLPVAADTLKVTFVLPKWIPGEHGPTGPITDLVNLRFSANGRTIPWQRDPIDMYAFQVTVPEGATEVDADFSSVNLGSRSTPVQGNLTFNRILLYPVGTKSDEVRVRPSVTLPAGWQFATALPGAQRTGDSVRFGEVSLTMLVDSPIMMGSIMKEFNITPPDEPRPHFLDVFAETAEGLAIAPERVDAYRNLVAETGALFGARHYTSYRFLVEEDGDAEGGLEHHESSDDQVPELGMVLPAFSAEAGYLLAHELTHSWNGKYRRPAGLATANYQDSMIGSLLWVYEGFTSYLAEVLDVRSGLDTPERFRDRMANVEAQLDYSTGRDWRPLEDTATAAQLLYSASPHWASERRGWDYYTEGRLLWLEVDCILRARSGGKKSIDDFTRAFYGPPGGGPTIVPYTLNDVVKSLNSVMPYDWASFFKRRLNNLRPEPPAQGLEAAGWHVAYTEVPNDASKDAEAMTGTRDMRYSIGLMIDKEGTIVDVLPDSPAGHVGLAPEWKIAAVDHLAYSPEVLSNAVTAAKYGHEPIVLMVLRNGYYTDFSVDYHDGLRYPHLERITGKPDLLPAILKPHRQ